jgi:hypothetical protein
MIRPGNYRLYATQAVHTSRTRDELAELGLTEEQAERVLEWHRDAVWSEVQDAGGVVVSRLLGFILGRPGSSRIASTRLRALGMAFAAGLNDLTGCSSMTEAARGEGCSPKALSLVAAEAAAYLGLPAGPNRKGTPPGKESFKA